MRYKLILSRRSEKDLKVLPPRDRERVLMALKELRKDPRSRHCRKLVGRSGQYRMVVWPYRVIYFISDVDTYVDVVRIAHRKEVYQ